MSLWLFKLFFSGPQPVRFLLSKCQNHTQPQPNHACTMVWHSHNGIFCLVFIFPLPPSPHPLSNIFDHRNTLNGSLRSLVWVRLLGESPDLHWDRRALSPVKLEKTPLQAFPSCSRRSWWLLPINLPIQYPKTLGHLQNLKVYCTFPTLGNL